MGGSGGGGGRQRNFMACSKGATKFFWEQMRGHEKN